MHHNPHFLLSQIMKLSLVIQKYDFIGLLSVLLTVLLLFALIQRLFYTLAGQTVFTNIFDPLVFTIEILR
jgi:hypothetical protein